MTSLVNSISVGDKLPEVTVFEDNPGGAVSDGLIVERTLLMHVSPN